MVRLPCFFHAGIFRFLWLHRHLLGGCAKLLGFEFPLNFACPSSYPEIRLISLATVAHHTFHLGCGTIDFCLSAEEEKGGSYYTAICWLLWCSWDYGMEQTGHLSLGAHTMVFYLVGYRLLDRATVGTAIDRVMKKRYFVPFSVGLMFAAFVLHAAFFRPKTLQTSGYVLSALFGFQHVTGEFLLTTGTIVLLFISLFLVVAQERNQFIDRLALYWCAFKIPAYVCAFLALELFPATGPVPSLFPVLSNGTGI